MKKKKVVQWQKPTLAHTCIRGLQLRLKKCYKKFAFSLIEMLMALLVASIMMAAIAPVVTKKYEERVSLTITGGGSSGGGSTPETPVATPKVCAFDFTSSNAEQECEYDLPNGLTQTDAYAIIVSGGGGGAAATKGSISSSSINSSVYTSNSDMTFKPFMKEMTIQLVGGGGSGGGGNGGTTTETFTPSDTSCRNLTGTDTSGHTWTSINAPIAVYSSGANVCVTAYPQHPDFSVSADNYTESGDDRTGLQNGTYVPDICHKYTSFNSANTISDPQDYYVCTYTAAVKACSRLATKTGKSWRIPTQTELGKFGYDFASATIPTGMQACNANSGSYQCPGLNSGSNRYYPYYAWSSGSGTASVCYTDSGSTPGPRQYTRYLQSTSTWGENNICTYKNTSGLIYYFSVRCVLGSDSTETFSSFMGGGGSSGMYANVTVPEKVFQYLAKNNHYGRLKLTIGSGGSGVGKGTNGNAGDSTTAQIYDAGATGSNNPGTLLWQVTVPGGTGGYGATYNSSTNTGSHGSGGTAYATSSTQCKYFIDSNLPDGTATGGTASAKACNAIGEIQTLTKGGDGGAGTNSSVGTGGTSSWSSYGGGSAGVSCTSASSCSTSSSGAKGAAKISYKTRVPGIGGAGGGAGGYARVKFTYNSGDSIKAVVGKGGAGGTSSQAAQSGEQSKVVISSTSGTVTQTFTVTGGIGASANTAGSLATAIDGSSYSVPLAGSPGNGGTFSGSTTLSAPSNVQGNSGISATLPNGYALYSNGGNGSIIPIPDDTSPYFSVPQGGNTETGTGQPQNLSTLYTRNITMYHNLTGNDTDTFKNNYISTLAAKRYMNDSAGFGGGGGGWKYNSTPSNETVADGASGQNGYVFIYFGINDN